MSQCEQILAHLQSGKSITPLEALAQYNCFRLGARIHHLRTKGYKIKTDEVKKGDKRFASYRLVLEEGKTI